MSFDPIDISEGSARERLLKKKEVDMTKKMKEVMDFTKAKLANTRVNQKRYVDKKRSEAPEYK
jgi:hypothetical protein